MFLTSCKLVWYTFDQMRSQKSAMWSCCGGVGAEPPNDRDNWGCEQWHSSHLVVLALCQGWQAPSGRQNEALLCTQQAKIKKVKQENDLQRGSKLTLQN